MDKLTCRPKNGAVFTAGQVIRLEFPAQGYVNPTHTTIEFDVTLSYPNVISGVGNEYVGRFQNNIQSIFSRVRIMYGSTPLEDIMGYNIIVRNLTEWTSGNPHGCMDQSTISEGIGGVTWGSDRAANVGLVNVRQRYIQGASRNGDTGADIVNGRGDGVMPNGQAGNGVSVPSGSLTSLRRYQIQLAAGLFTQEKLVSSI